MYFQNTVKLMKGDAPEIFNGMPFCGIGRLICSAEDPWLLRSFTAAALQAGILCIFPVMENEEFEDIPGLRWNKESLRLPAEYFGALEMARILGVKGIQREVLESVFLIAGNEKLPLYTLSDLSAVLEEILQVPDPYQERYGNLAAPSLRALLRSVRRLEGSELNAFFGPCSLTKENGLETGKDGRGCIHQMELPPGCEAFFSGFAKALTECLRIRFPEEKDAVKVCIFLPEPLFEEAEDLRLLQTEAQKAGILFCLYGPIPLSAADKSLLRPAFTLYGGSGDKKLSPGQKRFLKAQFGDLSQNTVSGFQKDTLLLQVRGRKTEIRCLADGLFLDPVPAERVRIRDMDHPMGAGKLLSERRRERSERKQALEREEQNHRLQIEAEKLERQREKDRLREEKEARLGKERLIKERQRKLAPLTRFGNSVISSIGREIGRSLYRAGADRIIKQMKKKS